jgi:hypothetical protein
MRRIGRDSIFAFAFYSACAIVAVWQPLAMAAVITVSWCVWLVMSLQFMEE